MDATFLQISRLLTTRDALIKEGFDRLINKQLRKGHMT